MKKYTMISKITLIYLMMLFNSSLAQANDKNPIKNNLKEPSITQQNSERSFVQENQLLRQQLQSKDQQIQLLQSYLKTLDERLKIVELKSIGPKASPASIDINKEIIQTIINNVRQNIGKFKDNEKAYIEITNSEDLTKESLSFFMNYSKIQNEIKVKVVSLEQDLRQYQPEVFIPVLNLEDVLESPTQLKGFEKYSDEQLSYIDSQLKQLKREFSKLPENNYKINNPTKEEDAIFFKNWGKTMTNSNLVTVKPSYHKKVIEEYKQAHVKLKSLNQEYQTLLSYGVNESEELINTFNELNEIDLFSKTSPKDLAKSLNTNYIPNVKLIKEDNNLAIFLILMCTLPTLIFIGYTIQNRRK
jgi:hypothetical protein